MNVQQTIDRNREAMRLFETCINTNDLELGRKLIADTAAFKTPVSLTPLKLVPMQPLDPDHADSIFKKWTLK